MSLSSARGIAVLAALGLAAANAPQAADAAMAGYRFTGAVTSVYRGPSCPVDPLIVVGTAMKGLVLYDLDTPDLDPDPRSGEYWPQGQLVLEIGNLRLVGMPPDLGVSTVDGVGANDSIRAGASGLLLNGYRISQFFVGVDGPLLLPDDALPTVPIDITQTIFSRFSVTGGSSSDDWIKISGAIGEWVRIPEPSTIALVTGFAGLCLRRRRRVPVSS